MTECPPPRLLEESCQECVALLRRLPLSNGFSDDHASSPEEPCVDGVGTWTQHQDCGCKENTQRTVRYAGRSELINNDSLQREGADATYWGQDAEEER